VGAVRPSRVLLGAQGSARALAPSDLKDRRDRCTLSSPSASVPHWHTVSGFAAVEGNAQAHALARHPPTCQDFAKCNLVGTHPAGGIENT
jgi:hypothetical protein